MYELFDTRTGNRVSVSVYYDEQRAWDALERIYMIVALGGRQDLKDSIDFYSVRLTSTPN